MKTSLALAFACTLTALCWLPAAEAAQLPTIGSAGYLTRKAGRVYLVESNQITVLRRPWALTPELTVLTNGIIRITGDGTEQLVEGQRLTLDGFWLSEDGTLFAFKPHYMIKDRVLLFVKSGVPTRVDHDVTLSNGAVIRTDATFLTAGQRLLRLQDGHMVTEDGQAIAPADHVTIANGKLVLQKDGSIIPLPVVSTIGMSDNTRVSGNGLVTMPNGDQFTLAEGQRLTVEGAAMPDIQ